MSVHCILAKPLSCVLVTPGLQACGTGIFVRNVEFDLCSEGMILLLLAAIQYFAERLCGTSL